mmetsp:Transcript_11378/g.19859  ORF Transcript_11378/g.19859 Transcript_11378/m.19859 type:complete len:313 (-) Transcript_11378:266-1204(-)
MLAGLVGDAILPACLLLLRLCAWTWRSWSRVYVYIYDQINMCTHHNAWERTGTHSSSFSSLCLPASLAGASSLAALPALRSSSAFSNTSSAEWYSSTCSSSGSSGASPALSFPFPAPPSPACSGSGSASAVPLLLASFSFLESFLGVADGFGLGMLDTCASLLMRIFVLASTSAERTAGGWCLARLACFCMCSCSHASVPLMSFSRSARVSFLTHGIVSEMFASFVRENSMAARHSENAFGRASSSVARSKMASGSARTFSRRCLNSDAATSDTSSYNHSSSAFRTAKAASTCSGSATSAPSAIELSLSLAS